MHKKCNAVKHTHNFKHQRCAFKVTKYCLSVLKHCKIFLTHRRLIMRVNLLLCSCGWKSPIVASRINPRLRCRSLGEHDRPTGSPTPRFRWLFCDLLCITSFVCISHPTVCKDPLTAAVYTTKVAFFLWKPSWESCGGQIMRSPHSGTRR